MKKEAAIICNFLTTGFAIRTFWKIIKER